jgi:GTPase SAR1 family protein
MAPLVPVVAAGVVLSWYVARKLRRRKYRIAVLGARYSGKTTLINSWRGKWLADQADPGRTQTTRTYAKTKLTAEGLRLEFTKLSDVSGEIHAWPIWADRVKESRYVLYLVDARALAGSLRHLPARNWQRLEDDAGLMGGWLDANRIELCLLVVTHTDEDARLGQLGEDDYRELITAQLDTLMLKLGGPRRVRVVVGSLKRLQDAQDVTTQIMRHIIGWEKSK